MAVSPLKAPVDPIVDYVGGASPRSLTGSRYGSSRLVSHRQNAGEFPAVCRRREACSALEQPTKEGRIFVADTEADLIDADAFRLNKLLGLLDA